MKFKLNNKYFRWGLTAFLVSAAAITFYYFIFHSSNIKLGFNTLIDILMPIVFGFATAYLLTPILNFVEKKALMPLCVKFKIKETKKQKKVIRAIGILITTFLFVAAIYLLISILISQIVPSVQGIIANFDAYTDNVLKWSNQIMEDYPGFSEYATKGIDKFFDQLEEWLNDFLPSTASFIKTVSLSVINVLGVLWDFIIGFVISIYVLSSKEHFAGQAKKSVYALFERDTANIIIKNFRFTHKTFSGFLSGKIVDSIIIGVLCFIGTSFMKTPYALLISVIIGVTNIIPFFGPFLGAIPSIILIFVVDPMHPLNCVYFAIFALVLQQVDGNIIGPKILGNSTGLAGFWVIFSITLFGGLFGVFGMIVGVPIFAVIYAAVRSMINAMLEKKNMPEASYTYESVDYIDDEGIHLISSESEVPKWNRKKTVDTNEDRKSEETKEDTEEEK